MNVFQLFLDTHYWTAVNHFFTWGSLAAYFALTFTMSSNGMFLIFTSSFPFLGQSRAIRAVLRVPNAPQTDRTCLFRHGEELLEPA